MSQNKFNRIVDNHLVESKPKVNGQCGGTHVYSHDTKYVMYFSFLSLAQVCYITSSVPLDFHQATATIRRQSS